MKKLILNKVKKCKKCKLHFYGKKEYMTYAELYRADLENVTLTYCEECLPKKKKRIK